MTSTLTAPRLTYRELRDRPEGVTTLQQAQKATDTRGSLLVAVGGTLTPVSIAGTAYLVHDDTWWYSTPKMLGLLAALAGMWLGAKALTGWKQTVRELKKYPRKIIAAHRADLVAAAVAAEEHYQVTGLQISDIPQDVGTSNRATVWRRGRELSVTCTYPHADSPLILLEEDLRI